MNKKTTKPILVVSLNPTVQKTLVLNAFEQGGVNRCGEYLLSIGGKGANASRVIKQLGHEPVYLTQAGGYMKDFFLTEMGKDGVRTEWVDSGSEIRFCYTVITKERFSASEIVESGKPVAEQTDRRVREMFAGLLPECGSLIIAGSKTPGFSDSIYFDMIDEARNANKETVVDLTGENLRRAMEQSPGVVKINMYEFITTFMPEQAPENQTVGPEWYKPVMKRGIDIYQDTGTRFVLSNGKQETLIIDGETVTYGQPELVDPVNPIGSGDAFTGGLTAGLTEGRTLHDAALLGMDCAKRNLQLLKTGTIK